MSTALITGASRGLGLALARELAHRHWRLIIDARSADALGRAAAELRRHTDVTAIPGDVTDPAHRDVLIAAASPGLDVLVNNASTLGPSPMPALADFPLHALERVYAVNVHAPIALTAAAIGLLRDGGRVLNLTSDAAIEPYPGWGGYGSTKAALEQATAILAAERPELRVYAVDPGDMRTQMHQDAFPARTSPTVPSPRRASPACWR